MTGDDELLARLRRIAGEADPPPPSVADAARAAFAMRQFDTELAELLADSDLVGPAVRGGATAARQLSFESAAISLELQIERGPDGLAVRGVAAGATGTVELTTTAGDVLTGEVDDQGWFGLDTVPDAALRLRLQAADGTVVTTGWIRP